LVKLRERIDAGPRIKALQGSRHDGRLFRHIEDEIEARGRGELEGSGRRRPLRTTP